MDNIIYILSQIQLERAVGELRALMKTYFGTPLYMEKESAIEQIISELYNNFG